MAAAKTKTATPTPTTVCSRCSGTGVHAVTRYYHPVTGRVTRRETHACGACGGTGRTS
jgi:DnaJ-class molecular chaperone